MTFTVYGKPQGKARPRFTRAGHAYTPESTRDYEESIRMAYIAAEGRKIPAGVPVTVDITAWYAIPKSARGALRERMTNGELVPTVKPDWDNVAKAICDALNGLAWHDDAQVTQATVRKVYGISPMVRVEIREATP